MPVTKKYFMGSENDDVGKMADEKLFPIIRKYYQAFD